MRILGDLFKRPHRRDQRADGLEESVLEDGNLVNCGKCGKQIVVKLREKGAVIVAVRGEVELEALRCQDCGFIVCVACSSPDPAATAMPRCPSCGSVGGPYFLFKEDTIGQRDVCGKCGITQEERLKQWNAPAPPGVVKIGDGRGAFMYCSHCQTGICGRCSIDLGMTAGCPICGTELLYMDGGSQ